MITFHFETENRSLRKRKYLKQFIIQLIGNEGIILNNIDYIFCTDAYLLQLNQKYLDHNTYTDILTFDLSEKENELTAEIYISTDRVKENATKFHSSFEEELHRVIFHGVLHLLGYDDHTEEEKKEMRAKENELLRRYFKEQ